MKTSTRAAAPASTASRTQAGEPQRAHERGAGRDPEPEHDAEHVPVESPVHRRSLDASRARPYPRPIDLGTVFAIGIFVLILVLFGTPVLGQRALRAQRRRAFAALQRARGARVIAMIHRQETVGVFGVPFYRFIDIDDSEAVLRAIRQTPPDAADRPAPAHARRARPRLRADRVRGALAPGEGDRARPALRDVGRDADRPRRRRDRHGRGRRARPGRPAARRHAGRGARPASWRKKPIERLDDRTLLLADMAEKALRHMKQVVRDLLVERLGPERAETIAEELAGGHYTHDDPITVAEATALGLPVSTGLPARGLRPDGALPAGGPAAAERPVRAAAGARRGSRAARPERFGSGTRGKVDSWRRHTGVAPPLLHDAHAPARHGAWRASSRRSPTASATGCASPHVDVDDSPKLCDAASASARSRPSSSSSTGRPVARLDGRASAPEIDRLLAEHLPSGNPDRSLAA